MVFALSKRVSCLRNVVETFKTVCVKRLLLFCVLTFAVTAHGREWFVRQNDPNALDTGDGSAGHPLRTINAAAQLAQPGDTITVGAGIYHEWVSPARAGSETAPIVYRSAPEHAAIVRGTDVLEAKWEAEPNATGVFAASLPQSAFVFGNTFAGPKGTNRNALVYFRDQRLPQVTTREQLLKTPGSWLASDDGGKLFIHLSDNSVPAPGAIEVTTRDRIFAPHRRGLSYIQVEGFIFERCATRPDWPQLGALSTRSGQFWIIRNNIVRDTTGKGIDCGSETWDADSLSATEPSDKHVLIGGHHLIESNLVSENFQCGIAAWNTDDVRIIGNIVRNNGSSASADKLSLTDFEAAAIKVHAFRNGLIKGNLVVSNSSFGIWLDNGWENARVTRNAVMNNCGAGIFVELGFGPMLIDHNFSAANRPLGKPYFGDGIYTHDASGVTIVHNTLLDNAHFGVQQIVVAERVYWPKRLAEASNENISNNVFYGNVDGAISLPLTSPRSHDNHSDHNVYDVGAKFVINGNNGRIPISMILREARDRLQAAELPQNQRPDLTATNRVPKFSFAAWQVVMQMDQNSTVLPEKAGMRLDEQQNLLHLDLPTADVFPVTPAGPGDDFDLLGEPVVSGARAGAIQNLHTGLQTVKLWPPRK